ncbi:MAG: thiamine pyrophosphate-dependent dehydrogenase E1 component subunit alpha [Candidatus Eremiobacterota bacterium]
MSISKELQSAMYYDMLRIRKVQLHIESLYHLDEMKTPVHLCIGQEAISTGVCSNLNKDDYISSSHRSHGHYLAKGGDLKKLIAELYCRITGCSKGRGGSMHLIDTSVGHMGSSSIVGGGIPLGTGMGLSIKMKKENKVSVIFFSDGAADEGVLYESVNFAILKKLPVIFVFENNQYSVCSHVSSRYKGENIFLKTSPDLMYTRTIDGNSVSDVYETANIAVNKARSNEGPSFIECKTYRMRGHAGSGSDVKLGYRTEEEVSSWDNKCPVRSFAHKLLSERLMTQEEINDMERKIDSEIDDAFTFARQSPLPDGKDLYLYLFMEEENLCHGQK